eukprot:GFUD01011554.1.p1 GENE.GFUD01011554.1~~GFUD01011554.1.p1  ORF type:complete len:326 (+),score=87.01 GFUD01011554.1:56-1033(+)
MTGMYRIENTMEEHASMVKYAVVAWGEKQPDMYLVSSEGVKVYTQRILLSFYSKTLCEVLENIGDDLAGVSVPASSSSLTMVLKVLVSGSVIASSKADLLEVGQAAEILGIVLKDRQIGYRKKNTSEGGGKPVVREEVAISGRRVSYRKKTIDASSEIKTEPKEEGTDEENVDNSESLDENERGNDEGRPKTKKSKKLNCKNVSELAVSDDNTCGQCGKTFPSAGRLKLHMNVHSEDKPYKCDVCEKGFSAPASLKNHKLLHTGETFKCEYCDYSAVQKGNLKSHRAKVHKDVLERNDQEEKVTNEEIDNLSENTVEDNNAVEAE